ncbi:MAG TPA: hypothetical protein PKH07_19940, partial [bacterium]|nr:hypothetical protein [bacterium]
VKDGYYEKQMCQQGGLCMADERPGDDNVWGQDPDKVVLPNQPYRLDFVMLPAAQVVVHLKNDEGKPIPNQRIEVYGPGYPSTSVFAQVDTDETGTARIANVPLKKYDFTLRLNKEGSTCSPVALEFSEPVLYEIDMVFVQGQNDSNALEVKVLSSP